MNNFSHVIIGSGIAGMSAALRLAEKKMGEICIITKGPLISGSTPLAQGGISAVTNLKNDSYENHILDTMKAGRYTNNEKNVKILVESGTEIIDDLQRWGATFSNEQHLEGGHSFPRIWNAKDRTGNNIAHALAKKVLYKKNITIIENAAAFHLDREKNIIFYRNFSLQQTLAVYFKYLIIATGGYSSLYAASTSPPGNTGDAISMAMQAGIKTKDLSKIQFHPTVLKKERFPRLLLTEAIRGAGAKIITADEKEIVNSLLPRDIVSRAVWKNEMRGENIFLDARHIKNFREKFPFISNILLLEFQINPEKDIIPITFGAHYCMGGIATNENSQTNIENIYAIGECANSGVHGDNRLASNSLLEGLVFAKQAVNHILQNMEKRENKIKISTDEKNKILYPIFISSDKTKEKKFFKRIQNTLSQYVSIERTKENLQQAKNIFSQMNAVSTREKNALLMALSIVEDC